MKIYVWIETIGPWGWRGLQPPRIFQIAIFGQKKKSGNIRAKPLDFRASNGQDIRARDFSPPPPPWTKLVPYAYDWNPYFFQNLIDKIIIIINLSDYE